jgi:hypothetical protein
MLELKTSTVLQQAPPVAQPASKRAATASAAPTPAAGPVAKGPAVPLRPLSLIGSSKTASDRVRERLKERQKSKGAFASSAPTRAGGAPAAAEGGADENRKTPPDERKKERALKELTKELG